MSSLERMSVQGIRSFGPEEARVITFHKPLTLIVGSNGAGKTTIIECLRYATTGSLPPNSKDGFVHDPKLVGEREVKASVRVQFTNMVGKKVTVSRAMSLTAQESGKKTFKTLDGSMKFDDGDKAATISSRCADLGVEMSNQLGVSKAILENVIFCHQEDSLWPLGESSVVKKKFDEIFAATRYTQALKEMDTLKKDKAAQLKIDKVDLDHLKISKEKAVEKRRHIELEKTRIREGMEEMDQITQEIDLLAVQLEELREQNNKILEFETKQATLNSTIDMKRTELSELEQTVTVFEETEEEMQKILEDKKRELSREQQSQEQIERQKKKAQDEAARAVAAINQRNMERGRREKEQEIYEKNLVNRDRLIRNLAPRLNIAHVPSGTLRKEFADDFMQRAKAKLDELKQVFDRKKEEYETKLRRIDAEIVQINSQTAINKDTIRRSKQMKQTNDDKIHEIEGQLVSVRVSQSDLDSAKVVTTAAREALQQQQALMRTEAVDAKIQSLQAERNRLDSELELVMTQQSQINSLADDRAKVDILRSDMQRERKNASMLFEENLSKFQQFFENDSVTIENCADIAKTAVERKRRAADEAKKALSEARDKVVAAKQNYENKQKQVLADEKFLSDTLAQYPTLSMNADLNGELTQLDSTLKDSQSNLAFFNSFTDMYRKYIKVAREHNRCPVCDRNFGRTPDELDIETFVNKQESMIKQMPDRLRETEQEVRQLENDRTRLRKLQPIWTQCRTVHDRLPILQEELRELGVNHERFEAARVQAENEERNKQNLFNRTTTLQQTALSIAQQNLRALQLQHELERLEQQISDGSGVAVTGGDLQTKMARLRGQLNDVKDKLSEAQDQARRHNERLKRLEQDYERKLADERRTQEQLDRKMLLQESVKEYEQSNENLEKEQQDAEAVLQTLSGSLDEQRQRRRELEQQFSEQGDRMNKEIVAIKDEQRKLLEICEQIESYTRGGSDQLQAIADAVKKLEEEAAAANQRIAELEKQSKDREARVREISQIESKVRDFLRFNRLKQEMAKHTQDLQKLERDKRKLGDPATLRQQHAETTERHTHLNLERSKKEGSIKELRHQVQLIERELNDKQYKTIDEQYRKQLINVKTTEMAITDLDKYMKAVDRAIMSYHAMKMEEINTIIRELWVDTYQGQDIDSIEIKSEDEKAGSRSYNYRVVMNKGNVGLDMRGRCSAGQKVLACLIIRLALAETFGLSCGVLALDEPTTNLDYENADRLANALDRIIRLRMRQSNFQLLVITHDENFMRKLQAHAEWYWQVKKDPQTQYSVIKKIPMSDIFGAN